MKDLEEIKKEQLGRIVGREKFWTITYANEMVLLVKNEEGLKGMMKRFKKFMKGN